MINEINGNIIDLALNRKIDVLVHGCNCQGVMGKGLAKQIKEVFPKAKKIDEKGEKPGTICSVMYPDGLVIVNAYTQIYYGKANNKHKSLTAIDDFKSEMFDSQENRYKFIQYCMKDIKKYYANRKIALPLIGCGLAGGDWKTVRTIIEDELNECDITIVHFN